MVAAAAVGSATASSAIFAVANSAVQTPPPQTAPSTADTFAAQYSPQIYAVVSNGSDPMDPVLTASAFNPNTKLPPLLGTGAIPIPGAPPGWSYPPLLIYLSGQHLSN